MASLIKTVVLVLFVTCIKIRMSQNYCLCNNINSFNNTSKIISYICKGSNNKNNNYSNNISSSSNNNNNRSNKKLQICKGCQKWLTAEYELCVPHLL